MATVPCGWGEPSGGNASSRAGVGGGDCAAAKLIRQIANGSIGKKDVEMVVTHFDKDLGWLAPFAPITTVYTKAAPADASPKAIPLVNAGWEQHAFVAHIARNYDRLAERTVFTHGRAPSCGFLRADSHKGGHLLLNVSVADYLLAAPSGGGTPSEAGTFAPITWRLDRGLTRLSIRSTYADLPTTQSAARRLHRPVSILPAGAAQNDTWLPFEPYSELVGLEARACERCDTFISFEEFFMIIFGRKPPSVLYVAHGAQLAASAAARECSAFDVCILYLQPRSCS